MNRQLTPPAFVVPQILAFTIDEVPITVAPLGVAKIAEAMALCAPVLDELMDLRDDTLKRLEGGAPDMDDLHDMLQIVQKHGQAGIELVALGVDQPRAWVAPLLPDRFAYLFSAVVMVNADFFSRARHVFSAAGALLAQGKAASTGQPSTTP